MYKPNLFDVLFDKIWLSGRGVAGQVIAAIVGATFDGADSDEFFLPANGPYSTLTLYTEPVTAAHGVEDGTLLAYMYGPYSSPSGHLKILSKKKHNTNNTGNTTFIGFVTDPTSPFTRTRGLAGICDHYFSGASTTYYADFGWATPTDYYNTISSNGGFASVAGGEYYVQPGNSPSGGEYVAYNPSGKYQHYAFILGGYSGNEPWDGVAAGYNDGNFIFERYGETLHWHLQWRDFRHNDSSLVFKIGDYLHGISYVSRVSGMIVPDADFSNLLVPLGCDHFVGTNEDPVTGRTPNTGADWVAETGSFKILNNEAVINTVGTNSWFPGAMVLQNVSTPDVWLTGKFRSGGSDNNSADHTGFALRWNTTAHDGWTVELYRGGGIYLKEWNGSGPTNRAGVGALTINATDWIPQIKAETRNGYNTIECRALRASDGYYKFGWRYNFAARNATLTKHGLATRRVVGYDPGAAYGRNFDYSCMAVGSEGQYDDLKLYSETVLEDTRTFVEYDLYADFVSSGVNYWMQDGTILFQPNHGVSKGAIYVTEAEAVFYRYYGDFQCTSTGANWSNGIRSIDPIPKAIGKSVFFGNYRKVDATGYGYFMRLNNTADGVTVNTNRVAQFYNANGQTAVSALTNSPASTNARSRVMGDAGAGGLSSAALILGGYNASGTPFNTGDTEASFGYGMAWFYKIGTNWKLGIRDERDNTANLYPVVNAYDVSTCDPRLSSIVVTADSVNSELAALLIPTNLNTTVTTGNTFTHVADCVIELPITTLPTGGDTIDVEFRRQDADNLWKVSINAAGDVTLYERTATVDTSRGSAAASATAGGRIMIFADGTDIEVWVSATTEFSYASASAFATETSGRIAFASGSVPYIADWARGTNDEYAILNAYDGV